MFEIKFRITDELGIIGDWDADTFDREGDLEGFFAINFNGHLYGYHHENELQEGEVGFELLTHWFEMLIKVYINLNNSKYVALSDIESYNTWLEFKLEDGELLVSVIENENKAGLGAIITSPFETYTYSDWKNVQVSKAEFKNELVIKANEYINSVGNINQNLLHSKRMQQLILLLDQINN